jgi:CheY-like chemotaxis protein
METEIAQPLLPHHILVVDDNIVNQRVAKALLKSLGCEVSVASNGQEALHLATSPEAHFDLCLMDVIMPVMDGIQATQKIRQFEKENSDKFRRLPIVGMTAMVEGEKNFTAAGMDGCYVKPITRASLQRVLETYARL